MLEEIRKLRLCLATLFVEWSKPKICKVSTLLATWALSPCDNSNMNMNEEELNINLFRRALSL